MTDLLSSLMCATGPIGLVNGYADPLATLAGIDQALSSGWHHDAPRKNIHPTRSKSTSIADYPFDTLTGWTGISGGSASAGITASGSSDPAIGNVLDMQTGATIGSIAGAQKIGPAIPDSFGALIIVELTAVGSNPADALYLDFQTAAATDIRLRFYNSAVETFLNGTWQLLFAHGGAFWTEWWIEARKETNGTYTISLYAGTNKVGSRNGTPPGGPPGNNNLILIQQPSATANRRSKVAILQLGVTQLPDAMRLTSVAVAAQYQPTIATFLMLAENVSEGLVANGDVFAGMSRDGGTTWMQVALTNAGHHSMGVLDTAKSVRIVLGTVTLVGAGTTMRWRVETAAGSFLPIRGVAMMWS